MTAQAASGELFHSFSKYLSSSSPMPALVRELLGGSEELTWWQKGPRTLARGMEPARDGGGCGRCRWSFPHPPPRTPCLRAAGVSPARAARGGGQQSALRPFAVHRCSDMSEVELTSHSFFSSNCSQPLGPRVFNRLDWQGPLRECCGCEALSPRPGSPAPVPLPLELWLPGAAVERSALQDPRRQGGLGGGCWRLSRQQGAAGA